MLLMFAPDAVYVILQELVPRYDVKDIFISVKKKVRFSNWVSRL